MINLSQEPEDLAQRLAAAQRLSLEDVGERQAHPYKAAVLYAP
jgi:hypothetical protein